MEELYSTANHTTSRTLLGDRMRIVPASGLPSAVCTSHTSRASSDHGVLHARMHGRAGHTGSGRGGGMQAMKGGSMKLTCGMIVPVIGVLLQTRQVEHPNQSKHLACRICLEVWPDRTNETCAFLISSNSWRT
eukprot:67287-Pelagomonas_calceolata.AAC.1